MTEDRQPNGIETRSRLLDWTKGQSGSEPLATRLLTSDGYSCVDPSHPYGGQDGGKDAAMTKDGLSLTLAVSFSRGQQSFSEIKRKFSSDLDKLEETGIDGFVFFTNQELKLGERKELRELADGKLVDLYHLDRIATLLDSPVNYGIRTEFLNISMTNAELVALYEQRDKAHLEELSRISDRLEDATVQLLGYANGGDSYLRVDLNVQENGRIELVGVLEGGTPEAAPEFLLQDVIVSCHDYDDTGEMNTNPVAQHPNQVFIPGTTYIFPEIPMPKEVDSFDFVVKVVASNGAYCQHFSFKRHDHRWWQYVLRFVDTHPHESLRSEDFESGYPDELKHRTPSAGSFRDRFIRPNDCQTKSP